MATTLHLPTPVTSPSHSSTCDLTLTFPPLAQAWPTAFAIYFLFKPAIPDCIFLYVFGTPERLLQSPPFYPLAYICKD